MKYHGMDLHKKYSTISVRNEEGAEEKFVRAQADIKGYVVSLGSEDSVVLEGIRGSPVLGGENPESGSQLRCD